jgi:hypothetical protein
VSDEDFEEDPPRFPDDDLRVDFGKKAPGSGTATPADITVAYEQRILHSVEAQAAGAQRALELFIR